jgi:hypothetical protein
VEDALEDMIALKLEVITRIAHVLTCSELGEIFLGTSYTGK